MNIAVFAYDFPHKKGQEFLLRLWLEDIPAAVVIGAPLQEVPRLASTLRTAPRHSGLLHPARLCARFGIPYLVAAHNAPATADLLRERAIDLVIIAGARIIKPHILAAPRIGLVNFHPGLIPEVRGLDALKWSVYHGVPPGVTAHLIDERIDAGRIVLRRGVPVFPDDSWLDVGLRLLEKQVVGPGDWQVKNRDAEPAGWAFEFRNDFFPDVDDTSFVLMALRRVAYPNPARLEQAIRRGLAWMISMQNRDGGWGAFDRDNHRAILTQIPFADHNAMIDPSTGDLTARVIECLGRFGWPATHPAIQKALAFLLRDQSADGSWYGRWGVNFIYGTGGVLRALEPFGLALCEYAQRAVAWLRSVQNPDGGFGESIASYSDERLKAKGNSTPSQTAWGLIGLLAAGPASDPAVERAIRYLVEHQNSDGSWDEHEFTGTGFPRVFYLKYHLYRNCFPLYAVARYRNVCRSVPEPFVITFSPDDFAHRNGNLIAHLFGGGVAPVAKRRASSAPSQGAAR